MSSRSNAVQPGAETYPEGGAATNLTIRELLALMREDWVTHNRNASSPGLHAIILQRFGAWRLGLPMGIRRKAASALYRTLNVPVINLYGIEIHDTTRLGQRVMIPHMGPVTIDRKAVVGDGCLIHQSVTIGRVSDENTGTPTIGRDVEIGVGAVLIGEITIGDGARIGPNAVVLVDVPPGATAFAPPARQMLGQKPKASDAPTGGVPAPDS
jgi:serine O-acetyltransferase